MLVQNLINIEYIPYKNEQEIESIKETLTGLIIVNREERALININFNQEVG